MRSPKVIGADGTFATLARWAVCQWLWDVELAQRLTARFKIMPKRWIVERIFGWLNHSRRLAKSYERTLESDRAYLDGAPSACQLASADQQNTA